MLSRYGYSFAHLALIAPIACSCIGVVAEDVHIHQVSSPSSGRECSHNLIGNGSFEEPVIDRFFWKVPAGRTLGDWTVGNVSVDIVSATHAPDYVAHDGNQTIDMAGTPGPGSLYQEVATVPGAAYELSFALSSNGGAKANGIAVYWDGRPLDSLPSPNMGSWQRHSYSVTADEHATRVEFIGTIDGNVGTLLDNVALHPVDDCSAQVIAH